MQNVSVIGAGTMGNGIAHVFAQKGFLVNLIDTQPGQLDKALTAIGNNLDRQIAKGVLTEADKRRTLDAITTNNAIPEGVAKADLVVEAATENTDLKLSIFRQLDEHSPPGCILASNTSSISITRIASATRRPGSVIGLHFMNPVPVMKLIEIINGYATAADTTRQMIEIAARLDKTPCVVNDYPGFIANRILMPMINEAVYSLYEGVAGVQEIDTVMKLGMAHPMGPLQLADFIGLDVCNSILNVLYDGFGNPKYAPCPLLTNMVTAGYLGVKSGEGFYRYTPGNKDLVVSSRFTG
ncbi:MAG TPA: 3-hydroxyacyl-CoA dehydrogenase NAD-binding domain-containing protein [Puia sp.]|jgi:3-hydroxybutyryl-CoA dehydrogenase|nr:3-hydroxyacyl-CoA dehydrogenase NAD-binding domain-containing protein [Puia sp.]